ncbi:hypothetical protein LUX12_09300 [Streptomyces somaliensis]|uniref:hypothetical protein n=1 Tax=Streptomyces somaliensis TaxID=78355 RepID=UPI0020CD620C|nr:hypothetical protein [Streptomyces somaliensis]MCP9944925.1 hypothetical protein [Streptomyces somaliensis]MCP9961852.1 hypothetical protein [Streptomyces somaliensis]MCP9974670.1 hypothetical protein [Streptomyces somaliensis]
MPPIRPVLPPPPPPPHLVSWPDREALLADRDRAMGELRGRMLGGARLAVFLLWLLLLETGWGLVGAALVVFDETLDPFGVALSLVLGGLGAGALVPAVYFQVAGVRRDLAARRLFVRWAALDRAPAHDARHRAPGASLAWLLVSFALCAAGLGLCVAVPATARPGTTTYAEVAYGVGAGFLLWLTGLAGAAKAVGHYRLAVRLLSPGPPAPRRAGRPASSARPPHA